MTGTASGEGQNLSRPGGRVRHGRALPDTRGTLALDFGTSEGVVAGAAGRPTHLSHRSLGAGQVVGPRQPRDLLGLGLEALRVTVELRLLLPDLRLGARLGGRGAGGEQRGDLV